ncbi:MAG: precorrin-6y C5,15-methyltransferase (decarboxylating) subunit CbiE [Dehalococcoidia bacterium]|nr:precorrin-6y C5,15-methyltransferase (decarboxylating) subunit CbiE [Dehalococcoidia bacterium]
MATITVVGVGPGDPDLLTLKARDVIRDADYVAGFETVLGPVWGWIRGEVLPMRYRDQEDVLDRLAAYARSGKTCVVCAWGDLNFSARELLDRVRRRADVVLIPGISSVQVACARLGLTMETSVFITLHARDGHEHGLRELVEMLKQRQRNLIVLPRPFDLMPSAIAARLLEDGIAAGTPLLSLQRLSLPGERIDAYTVESLASEAADFSDLTILTFPVER